MRKQNAVWIYPHTCGDPVENERIEVYGYLKGKRSQMLYEQFWDLKFKYRNREFWCRSYYLDTLGKNTAKRQEYIKHQLEEDKIGEQLLNPYPGSLFAGRK